VLGFGEKKVKIRRKVREPAKNSLKGELINRIKQSSKSCLSCQKIKAE
jgi:hypothetical protein